MAFTDRLLELSDEDCDRLDELERSVLAVRLAIRSDGKTKVNPTTLMTMADADVSLLQRCELAPERWLVVVDPCPFCLGRDGPGHTDAICSAEARRRRA